MGVNDMKEMDCVEVVVEKDRYAKYGVHQGMQGWICDPRNIDESWLVNFPQCGEKRDIATIAVKEKDLKLLPVMQAAVNEEIKARFDAPKEVDKSFADGSGLSDYVI